MTAPALRGERIRQLRDDLDIRQSELSYELVRRGAKMTPSHLAQVERNEKAMALETLVMLAAVLGTSTDYLLGRTDDPTPYSDMGDQVILVEKDTERREYLQRLFSQIERLAPPLRDEYYSILETLYAGVLVRHRSQTFNDLMRDLPELDNAN